MDRRAFLKSALVLPFAGAVPVVAAGARANQPSEQGLLGRFTPVRLQVWPLPNTTYWFWACGHNGKGPVRWWYVDHLYSIKLPDGLVIEKVKADVERDELFLAGFVGTDWHCSRITRDMVCRAGESCGPVKDWVDKNWGDSLFDA